MVRLGTCGCAKGAFAALGTTSHLPMIAGSPKRFEEGRGDDPGLPDCLGGKSKGGAFGFGRGANEAERTAPHTTKQIPAASASGVLS